MVGTQNSAGAGKRYDLVVVMPVYNEEGCIAQVVAAWEAMLAREAPNHLLLALNDGSKDATAEKLKAFSGQPRIEIVNKANSGHGPTILMGYQRAVAIADWVFQVDSDDELAPDHFAALWREREKYDFLCGWRQGRNSGVARRTMSLGARMAVDFLFRRGVDDVNIPYRLMRAAMLARAIAALPDDTFAPNVIISGLFARLGARIFQIPVPFAQRKTGTVSIMRWKLVRVAARSLRQTLAAARRRM